MIWFYFKRDLKETMVRKESQKLGETYPKRLKEDICELSSRVGSLHLTRTFRTTFLLECSIGRFLGFSLMLIS